MQTGPLNQTSAAEKKQNRMTIHRRQAGFSLVEILVVVCLVGLLAAIAIPNFLRSHRTAQTNLCISNLRAIDYAIQQWAIEQKKAFNSPVQFSDISSYLKNTVACPAGGTTFADSYLISTVGVEPTCQRFPGSHLMPQPVFDIVSSTDPGSSPASSDPSTSPTGSTGSPTSSTGTPSSTGGATGSGTGTNGNGNGNNGNGNHGNGNGSGNGGVGQGNGNGNTP